MSTASDKAKETRAKHKEAIEKKVEEKRAIKAKIKENLLLVLDSKEATPAERLEASKMLQEYIQGYPRV